MHKRWWSHPFVLGLVAPWLVYVVLLALQPGDRFAGWRNDVVWPATSYLTAAQTGLLLPFFGHVMVGGIGALLLQWPLGALAGKLGGERVGRAVSIAVMAGFPLLVFVHLKAVPEVVTVIEGHRLRVRGFGELGRWPRPERVVDADDVVGFSVRTRHEHWAGSQLVTLGVVTRSQGALLLAQRECGAPEACLADGDADLGALADRLGLAHDSPVDAGDGRHVLVIRR